MTGHFEARKRKILEQLETPDDEYHDLSPKGSIDEPIRSLIDDINRLDGLVTTSSCSGRISVFLEGRKGNANGVEAQPELEASRAGPGGKGGGGAWLLISHAPLQIPNSASTSHFMAEFGLQAPAMSSEITPTVECRYIHLKFEPMILHILTASLHDSQYVLTAALNAGFRESGAVSLSAAKNGELNPMVAVRSTGYSFDAIIGYRSEEGTNIAIVDEQYLRILVAIANERFKINVERIARFRSALLAQYEQASAPTVNPSKLDWEDTDARRLRKREEGLARQRALKQAQKTQLSTSNDGSSTEGETTSNPYSTETATLQASSTGIS